MSKINSKNLIYENTLPPFLARLQATYNVSDERQENKIKRFHKPRNHEEDKEDEPVYFDEETKNSLTREEWEYREKIDQSAKAEHGNTHKISAALENETGTVKRATNIATHGQRGKKRAGRIVGAVEVDYDKPGKLLLEKSSNRKVNNGINKNSKTGRRGILQRVKLSFDE